MLPVQRNSGRRQHSTGQRHAGTGGSNGAVAQLVARFVRIEEVGSSTLLSSTKRGSVELYFVRNEFALVYRFESRA